MRVEENDELVVLVTTCAPSRISVRQGYSNLQQPEVWAILLLIGIATSPFGLGSDWVTQVILFATPFVFYLTGVTILWVLLRLSKLQPMRRLIKSQPVRIYSILMVAVAVPFTISFMNLAYFLPFSDAGMLAPYSWATFVREALTGEIFMMYVVRIAFPSISRRKGRVESLASPEGELVAQGAMNEAAAASLNDGSLAAAVAGAKQKEAVNETFRVVSGQLVELDQLIRLEANGNFVSIVDENGERLVPGPLFKVLETLDGIAGVQVHRSSWIALNACEAVEREGRQAFLLMRDGQRAKIARPRQRQVLETLALHRIKGAKLMLD